MSLVATIKARRLSYTRKPRGFRLTPGLGALLSVVGCLKKPSKSLHVDSYQSMEFSQPNRVWGPINIPVDGSWGTYIASGRSTDGGDVHIRFKMNGDETRPINETVTFVIKY